jgi:riboflavin kinase/FMN adenylyltransferase
MQIEEELARSSPEKDTMLTVGVFDGVHLGHKHLLLRLREQAGQRNLLSAVVTFDPHPQKVLSPETRLPFLTDLDQRITLLRNEGIEAIVILPFTHELAELSAHRFLLLLKNYLRMKGLVIGPDFTLGRNKEGNVNTLRTLGEDMDFTVTVVPPITINGEVVSSTAVRKALDEGDIVRVHSLTGRPFSLYGLVIAGASRGMKLGFPTANLDLDPEQALPAEGVYATWAYIDDRDYESMTYIGRQPTFGGSQSVVEVYILDYHGNLYGQRLKIDIIERLRGEKQFNTTEELRQQITEDIKRGRTIFCSEAKIK